MEKRDARFYLLLITILVLTPASCAVLFIKFILPGFEEPIPQPTLAIPVKAGPQPEKDYQPDFIFYRDWPEKDKAFAELQEAIVEYDAEGFRKLGIFSQEEKTVIREIVREESFSYKIYDLENGEYAILLDPRKMHALVQELCPDYTNSELFKSICVYYP